jgi:hypothetical protein
VHPGFDVGGKNPPVDAFARLKKRRVDVLKPTAETREGTDVDLYRRTAKILQQVVMQVNAVPARLAREELVEMGEVVLDEMGKRLRWVHT